MDSSIFIFLNQSGSATTEFSIYNEISTVLTVEEKNSKNYRAGGLGLPTEGRLGLHAEGKLGLQAEGESFLSALLILT